MRLFEDFLNKKTEFQYKYASIAQMEERLTRNQQARGSIPLWGSILVIR